MNAALAELVASVPVDEGKKLLGVHLGVAAAAPADDIRNEILIDCVYDAFAFCVSRGFSWTAVGAAVDHVRQLVRFAAAGHSIDEAAVAFKDAALRLYVHVDERQLAMLADYVFGTVMRHFRLYKYVFSRERTTLTFTAHALVEAPSAPAPLRLGVLPTVYAYERKMAELEAGERELDTRLEAHQQQRDVNCARVALASTVVDVGSASLLSQSEAILKIVHEVVQNIGSSLSRSLVDEIADYSDEMNIKLAKASLPRPKELGPLPKYTLKPAISAPKSQEKRGHSPAPKSKTK